MPSDAIVRLTDPEHLTVVSIATDFVGTSSTPCNSVLCDEIAFSLSVMAGASDGGASGACAASGSDARKVKMRQSGARRISFLVRRAGALHHESQLGEAAMAEV